jgi:hypothetical protein
VIARWRKLVDTEGEQALSTLTARYLGAEHRDSPGQGCTFAALGSELARADNTIRSAATRGLRGQIELLAALLPGQSEADRRKKRSRPMPASSAPWWWRAPSMIPASPTRFSRRCRIYRLRCSSKPIFPVYHACCKNEHF